MAFTTTAYMTLADVKNAIRGLSTNEDDGYLDAHTRESRQ